MGEPRRFLRFVVPGLVFVIELTIYLWLSDTTWNWVRQTIQFSTDSMEKIIGAAVAALVASGGVGYVLSTLNHVSLTPLMFNYRALLEEMIRRGLMAIVDQAGRPITFGWSPNRNWAIITAIWHSRREASQRIKGAESRADSLFDVCHSAGAALWASLLAWALAWFLQWHQQSENNANWAFWLLPSFVVVLFACSYCRAARICRAYVGMILIEELERTRQNAAESIRKRAHEIWQRRGSAPGTAAQDWLQAEAELPDEAAKSRPVIVVST